MSRRLGAWLLVARRGFSSQWPTAPPQRSVLELPPRRALLYVPGDSEKKIGKAAGLGPDVLCLDLEDAVAANRKDAARDTVARALAEGSFGRSERAVRVNGVESGLCEDDLAAVLGGQALPDALVVPKVDTVEHVHWLFDRARSMLGARARGPPRPPALITMVESGRGLLNLRQVFEACLERRHLLRLEACIFGGDDFAASLGLRRQPGTDDTLFARRMMALTTRAYGLQPIDQVWIDYKDLHGLTAEALEGRRAGMAGKQIIHPSQIAPVQDAFAPDPHEVEEAHQLVQAFEEHQRAGLGAFTFRDKMIDQPTYLQARNLLGFAAQVGRGERAPE